MPRISDADVALIRDRLRIDDVIGETVPLRRAGSGTLKGLCPFHDEKTPSFTVRPEIGRYHCFGCGKSGDVFSFLMEVDALSFPEAVERLAPRAGVALTFEQGGADAVRRSERDRLLSAHAAAEVFFREQLAGAEAAGAREFLAARGFDAAAWDRFGVGYAPQSWDALTNHLRHKGFRDKELMVGGLARQGRNGPYDVFRGRLLWPIRSRAGQTIGFGARRLRDDDQGPKYLNTGETPLYKKSAVLYGLDLARKEIALRHQVVIVEGYTDVMAAHLAGVPTAVATCGTAFGAEHADVLRGVLSDQEAMPGEVIFTFDGDAAGQNAALKSFALDQHFVRQTFVAVTPGGMDPCELRLDQGDAAVRDLVASRVPLFTFVLRTTIDRYDLDTPDGRVAALDASVPVLARIRDRALRPEYARQVAGWLGMEVEAVAARVAAQVGEPAPVAASRRPADGETPDQRAHRLIEREALKLALQWPALVASGFDALTPDMFGAPGHRTVREAINEAGGVPATPGGPAWVEAVTAETTDETVRSLIGGLAVEPLLFEGEADAYAARVLAQVEEITVTRHLVEQKGRLQRTDPSEPTYLKQFSEVIALETRKRELREITSGGA
ncbi:MAG TPA: DNA primase [Mycobacteriales bacterium]